MAHAEITERHTRTARGFAFLQSIERSIVLPTYSGDAAIDVYDLCADGRRDNRGGTDADCNPDSDPNCASSRNAGVAHRREWAPDDCMRLCSE